MRNNLRPFAVIFTVYLACYAVHMAELMIWRTDQSFFGEAFIHKLIGIAILILAMRCAGFTWGDIGLANKGSLRGIIIGLAIGSCVFAIAYLTEYLMMEAQGMDASLSFYVSAYALEGNVQGSTTFATVTMCILFNIVNVVMEEGIFRGLFIKLAEKKVSFMLANVIAALLFGLWHIALPIRGFADGLMSGGGAFASGATYVLTTFLMSFQLGLLARMTNGLWAPMAAHFFNNTIVNLLHFTSPDGADPLQSVRITLAQTLAFVVILIAYVRWHKKRKAAA